MKYRLDLVAIALFIVAAMLSTHLGNYMVAALELLVAIQVNITRTIKITLEGILDAHKK